MSLLNTNIPGLKYGQKILASEIAGAGFGAFGSTWYVDGDSGNDNNSGVSPDYAKATIGAAITAAGVIPTTIGIVHNYSDAGLIVRQ